ALTLTPVLCAMILKPHTSQSRQRGLLSVIKRGIQRLGGRHASRLRTLLTGLAGVAAGYGVYRLLHIHFVHELVAEQIALTERREMIIGGLCAFLFCLIFRSLL